MQTLAHVLGADPEESGRLEHVGLLLHVEVDQAIVGDLGPVSPRSPDGVGTDGDAGDHELTRHSSGGDLELLGHLGDGQGLLDAVGEMKKTQRRTDRSSSPEREVFGLMDRLPC